MRPHSAGLLVGDEIVAADGAPFSPVLSFRNKIGSPVVLSIRREAGGAVEPLAVTRPNCNRTRCSCRGSRQVRD